MKGGIVKLAWAVLALVGAVCFATLALRRGESVNALWIVTAAVAIYLVAFRFYGRFIAGKVLELDAKRATPAFLHNDGLDYVPTNRHVLFGHHFAAIAGAGPLVGPVLAMIVVKALAESPWGMFTVIATIPIAIFMGIYMRLIRPGRSPRFPLPDSSCC